jgi:hypothetical protein
MFKVPSLCLVAALAACSSGSNGGGGGGIPQFQFTVTTSAGTASYSACNGALGSSPSELFFECYFTVAGADGGASEGWVLLALFNYHGTGTYSFSGSAPETVGVSQLWISASGDYQTVPENWASAGSPASTCTVNVSGPMSDPSISTVGDHVSTTFHCDNLWGGSAGSSSADGSFEGDVSGV